MQVWLTAGHWGLAHLADNKEGQVDLVHEQVPDELLRGAGRGSKGASGRSCS